MAAVILLDDYATDADIRAALLRGAALLAGIYHKASHQSLVSRTPKTRIVRWWTLDTPQPVLPLAFPVAQVNTAEVDGYTLDCANTCFFGGFLLGDFTAMHVPELDASDAETALSDVLATSFMLAMKDEYQLAYACQQLAYTLMGLYTRKAIERPTTPALQIRIMPYGI